MNRREDILAEIQKLQHKLHSMPSTVEQINPKSIIPLNETYLYLNEEGYVCERSWTKDSVHHNTFRFQKVLPKSRDNLRTLKKESKRIRAINRINRVAQTILDIDHPSWEVDWENYAQFKHTLSYDFFEGKADTLCLRSQMASSEFIFAPEEVWEEVIEKMPDRVIRIALNIE